MRVATATPDRPTPPRAFACVGCRYGTRVVDLEERDPEEDGEGWKPDARREVEWHYCTHPTVRDPAQSSALIKGRIFCGFREEGSCTAKR